MQAEGQAGGLARADKPEASHADDQHDAGFGGLPGQVGLFYSPEGLMFRNTHSNIVHGKQLQYCLHGCCFCTSPACQIGCKSVLSRDQARLRSPCVDQGFGALETAVPVAANVADNLPALEDPSTDITGHDHEPKPGSFDPEEEVGSLQYTLTISTRKKGVDQSIGRLFAVIIEFESSGSLP